MVKFLMDLIKALNPGLNPDEPRHVFRWRQTMAFSMALVLVVSFGHLFQSHGALEAAGVAGFASAPQVTELQGTFRDFRLTQLEEQIDRVRIRQCSAINMRNQVAADSAREQLNSLLRTWRSAAKYDYPVKSCVELLVPLG